MRSDSFPRRLLWLGALAAALGGCASVSEPFKAMSFGSSNASAPAAAAQPKEAPVAPAVQSAFESAAALQRAGRTAEAERAFRAIATANPELGGPHANLGVMLRQAGKLAESATELESAVRLNPRQPIYFNQLGVTYRQQGEFQKARDAYERAIALDAGYAAPLLNLGILCDLYLNDAPRALDLYGRYLALVPNGDATVTKWVADLKNRKPATAVTASRKEKA